MRMIHGAVCCIGAIFSVLGQVEAGMVFSQTPTTTSGWASDAGFPYYVADDFSLTSAATINEVSWRGNYSNTAPPTDWFTIAFYSNNSGVPGAMLESFQVGNAVNRSATGVFSPSGEYFDFTANLGSGISLLSSTQYWISIYDDSNHQPSSSSPIFYWAIDVSGGNARGVYGSQDWPSSAQSSFQTYFSLASNDISPTPEPASFALLAMGGGLGFIGRKTLRRQNTGQRA